MNKAILGGVISSYGVKLSYTESSKPQLSFALTLTEGEYHTYVPCLVVGSQAEALAETLEAGDYCLLEGKLSWKKETSKLQVVTFGVERLNMASVVKTSDTGEYGSDPDEPEINHEAPKRPKRRPYPKAALRGGFSEN